MSKLQSTTEKEFMLIGENLGEMSQFTNEIFQQVQSIVQTFSQQENVTSHNNIVDKLEGIKKYIHFNMEKTEEEGVILVDQENIFHKLYTPLTLLNKMVFQLNTLGFSIKAETTRIRKEDNEFGFLGEEVRKLAVDTKEKLDFMQTSRENVIQSIRRGREEMALLKEKEFLPLLNQLEQLLTEMSSYQNLVYDVESKSENVSVRFEDINTSTGKIIFELQFHDIVRQQIEHVQETIGNLMEEIQEILNSEEAGEQELPATIYAMTILSTELVENSWQTVTSALSSIFDKFEVIQDRTREVGDQLADLVQESLYQVEQILTHAIKEKEKIQQTLMDAVNVHSHRFQTMQSIINTTNNIREQIQEISSIGEDIGLISLNGLIQAHQLQQEGAVMGVVIGEIRNLVDNTQENVHSLEQLLENLDALIASWDMVEETGEGDTETYDIIEETTSDLNRFFTSLNDKTAQAREMGQTIQQQTRVYSENLSTTLGKITVGEQFDKGLSNTSNILKNIANEMQIDEAALGRSDVKEMLAQYRSNYTMASERLIHDKITGETSTEEEINDFDDNIELF